MGLLICLNYIEILRVGQELFSVSITLGKNRKACAILRVICTTFGFCWESAPDLRGAYNTSRLAVFKGPISRERVGMGKERSPTFQSFDH